ncbi:unnamed protein product [Caretta caretta]
MYGGKLNTVIKEWSVISSRKSEGPTKLTRTYSMNYHLHADNTTSRPCLHHQLIRIGRYSSAIMPLKCKETRANAIASKHVHSPFKVYADVLLPNGCCEKGKCMFPADAASRSSKQSCWFFHSINAVGKNKIQNKSLMMGEITWKNRRLPMKKFTEEM